MSLNGNRLAPAMTKGHVSVARLSEYWYIACPAKQLKSKPLGRKVLGIPMVLFRDSDGNPVALLDRCAHRNVPLSIGRTVDGCIECPYHGWQFNREGTCTVVPGLVDQPQQAKGRRVPRFATLEQDGFVWVYATADVTPQTEPFKFPLIDDPKYRTVTRVVSAQGTLHSLAENALDVPHTAFLHKGLFRGAGTRNEIEVVVRRGPDRVEAEYIGEPRPSGLAGRILSPSGGLVTHFDRFILPSVIQVEYSIGEENHIFVCAVGTPEEDFKTTLYAVVSFRMRIPSWLIKPILIPIALRIFKQDAVVLKLQTETIEHFGGEQYQSTEIDVLGREIWRLLRQAERGDAQEVDGAEQGEGEAALERRIKLLV